MYFEGWYNAQPRPWTLDCAPWCAEKLLTCSGRGIRWDGRDSGPGSEGDDVKYIHFLLIATIIAAIPAISYYSELLEREEALAQQAATERLRLDLESKRSAAINDIRGYIESKEYKKAIDLAGRFLSLQDAEIMELLKVAKSKLGAIEERRTQLNKEKRSKEIVELLKKIPEKEFARNLELYRELLALRPDNKDYVARATYYAKKLAEVRENEHLGRLGLSWRYDEYKDKMGGGAVQRAYVRSINEIDLDFPYSGSQRAELTLRKHPRYGRDVIFEVKKGQVLCQFGGCSVLVRFDDRKAAKYRADWPADHDSTTLFIGNYKRFVSRAKKAKRIYIEVIFYQQGTRVFEFNSAGLKF